MIYSIGTCPSLQRFFERIIYRPGALISGIILLIYILVAIFSKDIIFRDPTRGSLSERFVPPVWIETGGSNTHFLGTDGQGNDVLAYIIFGARTSLTIAFLSLGISAGVGTFLGALAGYYRGPFDNFVSRCSELLMAFPSLILAIGMMAFLGPGIINLIFVLVLKEWIEFYRLVRGETLVEKHKEYIEASRALGQDHVMIIVTHILPNLVGSVFALGAMRMGYMIIMESSLSFIGIGLPSNVPSWGTMISVGRDSLLIAWWVSVFPALAILCIVFSVNILGEWVKDSIYRYI